MLLTQPNKEMNNSVISVTMILKGWFMVNKLFPYMGCNKFKLKTIFSTSKIFIFALRSYKSMWGKIHITNQEVCKLWFFLLVLEDLIGRQANLRKLKVGTRIVVFLVSMDTREELHWRMRFFVHRC